MLLMMQRASFGKADVEHIAYSGLPIFLAAAAWSIRPAAQLRRIALTAGVLLIGVVLPLQWYHAMLFVPSLVPSFRPVVVSAPGPVAPPRITASTSEVQASLTKAVEHFGSGRTYYMHQLEYYRLPIYLKYQLKPFMYYPLLAAAFTAQDIDSMIDALRTSDAVVLVQRSALKLEPPSMFRTRWPFYATSSPLPGSTVFNLTLDFQWRLAQPLLRFLTTAYETQFEDGEIVGLALRGAKSPEKR